MKVETEPVGNKGGAPNLKAALRGLRVLCISAVNVVMDTLTAETQRSRRVLKLGHYLIRDVRSFVVAQRQFVLLTQ
jgi:hypothetical protein